MKKIKLLQELFCKAYNEALKTNSLGTSIYKRKGEEIYRVVLSKDKKTLQLFHYKTLILKVCDEDLVYIGIGARSNSDSTAINNALYWLGLDKAYKAFKHKNKLNLWKKMPKI